MQQYKDIIILTIVMWAIALYLLFKQKEYKNKKNNKDDTNKINSEPKFSMFENFLDRKEKEYDVIDAINEEKKQKQIAKSIKQQKQSKQIREISRNSKKQREKYLKELRKRAMIRDNYQCVKCGSKLNLNMHYKTYKNEPKEKLEDVVILCEECHYNLHTRIGLL